MGSLFFKIFAWVWALMALLVLTLTAIEMRAPQDTRRPTRRTILSSAFQMHARRAATAYAHGGTPALQRELTSTRNESDLEEFLFNNDGKELAGQTPPDEIKSLAHKAHRRGIERWQALSDSILWAWPVNTKFTFAVRLPRNALIEPIRNRRRLRETLAIIAAAGLICGALALYLSAPVSRLRAATRRLAAGDLTARSGVGKRRHDDLALLARDFDSMAERLQALLGTQRRLMGDISHELRSPLARLNVALELARRAQPGSEALPRHLERIGSESARLNELIESVLILTRLEDTETEAPPVPINLSALVAQICEDADFEAQYDGRRVILEAPDAALTVCGQEELLRRAIENVTRNAIRHTPPDTQVRVSLQRDEADAIVRVRDAGPGVEPESLEAIFQPFFRVETARERETGGVGLGLAIARRAIEHHKGTIFARNVQAAPSAPNSGLEVEMRLPLAEEG